MSEEQEQQHQLELQQMIDTAFQTGALEALMNFAAHVDHAETRKLLIVTIGSIIITGNERNISMSEDSIQRFQDELWEEYQDIAAKERDESAN